MAENSIHRSIDDVRRRLQTLQQNVASAAVESAYTTASSTCTLSAPPRRAAPMHAPIASAQTSVDDAIARVRASLAGHGLDSRTAEEVHRDTISAASLPEFMRHQRALREAEAGHSRPTRPAPPPSASSAVITATEADGDISIRPSPGAGHTFDESGRNVDRLVAELRTKVSHLTATASVVPAAPFAVASAAPVLPARSDRSVTTPLRRAEADAAPSVSTTSHVQRARSGSGPSAATVERNQPVVQVRPKWDTRPSSRSPSASMPRYASPTLASAAATTSAQGAHGAGVDRSQIETRRRSSPQLSGREARSRAASSRSSSPNVYTTVAEVPPAVAPAALVVPPELGAWYAPPTAAGLCFGGSVFRAAATAHHVPSQAPPPALPVEALPQLISVLVTGAELFALLRLRGVIQTTMPLAAGEDRLPATAVHQMLVTAFELEQLHALRQALGEPVDHRQPVRPRALSRTGSLRTEPVPEAVPPARAGSARAQSQDRGRSGSRASSAASSGDRSVRPGAWR